MNLVQDLKFGVWLIISVWAGWWLTHASAFLEASPWPWLYHITSWFIITAGLFYAGLIIHTATAPLEDL